MLCHLDLFHYLCSRRQVKAFVICLQFLRVDPAYTFIAQGLVIIVAVALDLRKYLAKK